MTMTEPTLLGVCNVVEWSRPEAVEITTWNHGPIRTDVLGPPHPTIGGDVMPTELRTLVHRKDEPMWPMTTGGLFLRDLYLADVTLSEETALVEWPAGREDEDLYRVGW